MANENSDSFLNCVQPVHQVGKNSDAGKKLFSSLSHDDLDKIIRGSGNNTSCKKKISQIGSSRIVSPPKINAVKEHYSDSFDVIKCLIPDSSILSDHDYAIPQVKKRRDSNVREKNIPNAGKSTSEQKAKPVAKESSPKDNENDLVGQIIQNMDQMKPEVISHLITAASQDGNSNADSTDQGSKETKKDDVFFKASHKYTYKNYKLSNNIVLQKANKSLDHKKLDSRQEVNNQCQNIILKKLKLKHGASVRYLSKKRCCFVCGTRSTLSTKDKVCSKCKRSGEEFPLLKQAQQQMLFLNCRSVSAPKQRAHLAALANENPGIICARDERRHSGIPKLKNQRMKSGLLEKYSGCDKDRTPNFVNGSSSSQVFKAERKIKHSDHSGESQFQPKKNKSSDTDINSVMEKPVVRSKQQNVSTCRVVGRRLIFNKHFYNKFKRLVKFKRHSANTSDKPNLKSNMLKLKRIPEVFLSDSDDNITDCMDNDSTPVKNANNYLADSENKLCEKTAKTERHVTAKHGKSNVNNEKLNKISVNSGKNVPETTGNRNFTLDKRNHANSSVNFIRKSKKTIPTDPSDHEATDNINCVENYKNTFSCEKVSKKSSVGEGLKRKQKFHNLKHRQKRRRILPDPSKDNVLSSDQDDKSESSSEVAAVIRPSSGKKPVVTGSNLQVLPKSKKQKEKKMLSSSSDDSDAEKEILPQIKKQKEKKFLSSSSDDSDAERKILPQIKKQKKKVKQLASDSDGSSREEVLPQRKKQKINVLASDSSTEQEDLPVSKMPKEDKILAFDSDAKQKVSSQNKKRSKKSRIQTSDSSDSKVLSDSDDLKVLSDSNESKVPTSDSDSSSATVSMKKMDGNVSADSKSNCRSPELCEHINIVTYVVDKDTNVKTMPDLLVSQKQKYCDEKEKRMHCSDETTNHSSKELVVESIPSPDCDQSSFMDNTDHTSSTDDDCHDSELCENGGSGAEQQETDHNSSNEDELCKSDYGISKPARQKGTFHRSSEIICLDLDDCNDSHESNHYNDNQEMPEAVARSDSFTTDKTNESVNEVPVCKDIKCTTSSQKQLVLENSIKPDPKEDNLKSISYIDRTKEIDIIDLSPCPSPSSQLVKKEGKSESCVEPAFCAKKASEKDFPSSLEVLDSDSKCKPNVFEGCIQSDTNNDNNSEDDISPKSCRNQIILTNVNETVPLYSGDTFCIKSEKVETEKTSNSTHNKNEAASANADPEDFQGKFCYKKLSEGLYLMGLPGQVDNNSASCQVASSPVPKEESINEFVVSSSAAATEIKNDSKSSRSTPSPNQEYQFSYKNIGEGITLMYMPDKESASEDEATVKDFPVSTVQGTSSTEVSKNSDHNHEVICISDESCVELSDDDDDGETQNKKNETGDIEAQTVNASDNFELSADTEKLDINRSTELNSCPSTENSGDVNQNEFSAVGDGPVLQISGIFSIPDWDEGIENHDGVNICDSGMKDMHAVDSEVAIISKENVTGTSSAGEGQCNMQDKSSNCNEIHEFESVRSTDEDANKTKAEVQDETKNADVLLEEISNSVKGGQLFFNAVSELDSVTSANIIDLELRSADYSSAIQKARKQIYEELQQMLNKNGEEVSSEELQSKINMLRGLELLIQKESQEPVARSNQESKDSLSSDYQNSLHSHELQVTNPFETQPFGGEPMVSDSPNVDEEQDPDIIVLSPGTSDSGLIRQSNFSEKSVLTMLLTNDPSYLPGHTDFNNQNKPPSYDSYMQSQSNVVPSQQFLGNNSFSDHSVNSTSVIPSHFSTNAQVTESVLSLPASALGNAVNQLPADALSDSMCHHPNAMLTNSNNQLPSSAFRSRTVQPSSAYSLQHYNVSHPVNYQPLSTTSEVFSSVGASGEFISQVQDFGKSDITFCVMCPNLANAVCKSCTKVAYCGEACAVKYWNEVHHKVCMKL